MKIFNCIWVALVVAFEGNRLSYEPEISAFHVTALSEAEAIQFAWKRVKNYPDRLEYTTEEMFIREVKREALEKILNDEPFEVNKFPEIKQLKSLKDEGILDLDYLDA